MFCELINQVFQYFFNAIFLFKKIWPVIKDSRKGRHSRGRGIITYLSKENPKDEKLAFLHRRIFNTLNGWLIYSFILMHFG